MEQTAPGVYRNPEHKKQIQAIFRSMEIDPEYFNEWERNFLRSIDRSLSWGGTMTPEQSKAFTKLHQKHLKR